MTEYEIAYFANLIRRTATCARCGAPFHPLQPCPQPPLTQGQS